MMKNAYETKFIDWYKSLDKRLSEKSTKTRLVGDTWTIADFAMAAFFGYSEIVNSPEFFNMASPYVY
jgi:glutathione S-transferase